MTAYRRVYGFGQLRADCRGPGSAPEPYAHFEYGTTFTLSFNSNLLLKEIARKRYTACRASVLACRAMKRRRDRGVSAAQRGHQR